MIVGLKDLKLPRIQSRSWRDVNSIVKNVQSYRKYLEYFTDMVTVCIIARNLVTTNKDNLKASN